MSTAVVSSKNKASKLSYRRYTLLLVTLEYILLQAFDSDFQPLNNTSIYKDIRTPINITLTIDIYII